MREIRLVWVELEGGRCVSEPLGGDCRIAESPGEAVLELERRLRDRLREEQRRAEAEARFSGTCPLCGQSLRGEALLRAEARRREARFRAEAIRRELGEDRPPARREERPPARGEERPPARREGGLPLERR